MLPSYLKRLPVIFLIAVIILLLLFLILLGFNLWLLLLVLVWLAFYLIFIRKSLIQLPPVANLAWIVLAGLFVCSLIFTITLKLTATGSTAKSTNSTKLTAAECAPLYQKYNNKVLKLSGQDITGQIVFNIRPEDCYVTGQITYLFHIALPQNPHPDVLASLYNYIGYAHSSTQTTRSNSYGTGAIFPVYANAGVLPAITATYQEISSFYSGNNYGDSSSEWFYNSCSQGSYFDESYYQRYLNNNVFELIDGLPYMQKTPLSSGGFSYSIDYKQAELKGQIVKSFSVTVSE